LSKTAFSARDQHVLSFLHWAHHFLETFNKVHEFVQKTAFSARDQHVLPFLHWANHYLGIFSKVHQFVQKSFFCPRSARLLIFALSAPIFSDFQQSAPVCPKQRFQPEISTFCHFSTARTTF